MNRTQVGQGPAREATTIRPPDTADLAALGGFFAGLSMRSRVQRFFAPVRLSPAMIRLACGLGADGPAGGTGHSGPDRRPSRSGGTDALVATLGGVIIGHGMAVDRPADRSAGRTAPPEGRVTEIGVVVADAWQGQGVGSALVGAPLWPEKPLVPLPANVLMVYCWPQAQVENTPTARGKKKCRIVISRIHKTRARQVSSA